MENNIDKLADMIADKALDEFTYKGKSLREWVELMVAAESVVEVRMIEEFEKIKAELQTPNLPGDKVIIRGDCYISLSYMSYILDKHLKELNNEERREQK